MRTIVFLLFFAIASAQAQQPSTLAVVCNGNLYSEVPQYTYFSDLENSYEKFIGEWVYTNGNQILMVKISKVTQFYFPEDKIFSDYLIGDYRLSNDGGNTYVENSIDVPYNPNRDMHPMYTPCVESNSAEFIFKDILLDKKGCYAKMEFNSGNYSQALFKLSNPKGIVGVPQGQVYNAGFSLPSGVLLTRQ